ncbi:hypothetical protein DICVIV_12754, partial [Dictyocaulus viviparus]
NLKDNIEIPRHHLPDPEAEAIPGTSKQDSFADLERNWLDSGVDRIFMDAASAETNPCVYQYSADFAMGNDQSVSKSSLQPSPSSSAFSFLPGTSSKKPKGVVVISSGNSKVDSVEDDEIYKRFQVEASTALVYNVFLEKKKIVDNFDSQLHTLDKLRDDVLRAQLMLEEIVPIAETLNELLVPSERLPSLSFSRVLERTPVSTSASSSQQSTPRHVLYGGSSLAGSSARDNRPRIAPIEEVRVVDKIEEPTYIVLPLVVSFRVLFDNNFSSEFFKNDGKTMNEPDLSFIISDIDLSKVAPLNRRQVVAFVTCYLQKMLDYLNAFASRAEQAILLADRQLRSADIKLQILESKLSKIPDPPLDISRKERDSTRTDLTEDATVGNAIIDKSKPYVEEDVPKKSNEAGAVSFTNNDKGDNCSPPVLLVKDDPAFNKYFKMLKLVRLCQHYWVEETSLLVSDFQGVVEPAVKLKMQSEGVDPALLDKPNAPSPNAMKATSINELGDHNDSSSISSFSDSD